VKDDNGSCGARADSFGFGQSQRPVGTPRAQNTGCGLSSIYAGPPKSGLLRSRAPIASGRRWAPAHRERPARVRQIALRQSRRRAWVGGSIEPPNFVLQPWRKDPHRLKIKPRKHEGSSLGARSRPTVPPALAEFCPVMARTLRHSISRRIGDRDRLEFNRVSFVSGGGSRRWRLLVQVGRSLRR